MVELCPDASKAMAYTVELDFPNTFCEKQDMMQELCTRDSCIDNKHRIFEPSHTLRRKEAELRVRSLHLSTSIAERLLLEQTVPETDIMDTLIKKATASANPLSIRKYLQASCVVFRI